MAKCQSEIEVVISSQRWKEEFIENLQKLVKNAALLWLETATKIDGTEKGNEANLKIFFQTVEEKFDDLILDITILYEKYLEIYDTYTKKLSKLETELGIESSPKISKESSLLESTKLLKSKIEKLEILKRDNLKEIIERKKTELEKLWENCCCGATIKNGFPLINTFTYSTEVVGWFDEEITKWKNFYEEHKAVMEKLNEHTKLKDNLMEMEVNVDRDQLYKNRGGELLKVARKTDLLKARIKKIEDNLMEMADNYLEQNGQPLLIFDQTMIEYLNKQYKKRYFSERSPRTPTSKPPKSGSTCTTPTPGVQSNKKMVRTQPIERTKPRKTPAKKKTITLPKFKLNETRTNPSPKKSLDWKPSRVSMKLVHEDDSEGSWTTVYSEFEKEVTEKNVPRSTSIFKET
ncbi:hypothetical protein MTP99_019617 [Tenebrio molitor]|nr:hypothetical protein MTP99_019617 [Tenebrio molitor]